MTADHGWSRETFSFAIALQNLVWGLGSPFAGALAGVATAPGAFSSVRQSSMSPGSC